MMQPPELVGGAKVVRWSAIDGRHRQTGSCRQIVAGGIQGPAAGLAICQYEGETAYVLFGCDPQWNTVTDTWHESLEDALEQAELGYQGVSGAWKVVKHPEAGDGALCGLLLKRSVVRLKGRG